MTDLTDDELLERLGSHTHSESTAAAEELARRGTAGAFDAIWRSIRRDIGWEFVPEEKAAAAGRVATDADLARIADELRAIDPRLEELERREEEDDDPDAGDENDQIFREHAAARLILVAAGARAVPYLVDVLRDGGPTARGLGAALALGRIGEVALGVPLRAALERETEPEVLQHLIDALDRCEGADACDAVAPFLRAGSDVNSGAVVRAAGVVMVKHRGTEVLPDLLALARHENPMIRAGTIPGLAALAHPDAVAMLRRLADDDHPRPRMLAGRALADLGPG